MKAFSREARIVNWVEPTGDHRRRVPTSQHCASCVDDGFVEALFRREGHGEMPELAPCPFCMEGWRREFPPDREGRSQRGAWGSAGYWRGQDVPIELFRHPAQDTPLSAEQQRANARAVAAAAAAKLELQMSLDESKGEA